jgi:hypothetical protein
VKRFSFICSLAALSLVPVFAVAQETAEVPKAELALGYSYLNGHPTKSQVTSFNMNGGGIGLIYNVTHLIGVKFDFMGYTGSSSVSNPTNTNSIKGSFNQFTYLFGPQFTIRHHKVNYFAEALFGAGHSSGFYQATNYVNPGTGTAANSNNSFATEFGGGLDWKVSPHLYIRPVEVDYLLTRYSANTVSAQQNYFKYTVGVNIPIGSK